ncbi:MAG: CvpA family protein, partial [Campylobacterales bacterium]|nr:CvpA family protein [Campylobacterales bacterium]
IIIFIGKMFEKLIHLSGLGLLNKFFGFIVAGGKVFLIFSIIIYASSSIKLIKENTKKFFNDSIMYPILLEAGSYIVKIDTQDFVKNQAHQLEDSAREKVIENLKNETIKRLKDTNISNLQQENRNSGM